jgi:hypothetical protein
VTGAGKRGTLSSTQRTWWVQPAMMYSASTDPS